MNGEPRDKMGERIGALEVETAVQDNRIQKLEQCQEKLEKTIGFVPWKTTGMVATVIAIVAGIFKMVG